jgi:hypothetical protein
VNAVTIAVLVRTLIAINKQARAADRQAKAAEAKASSADALKAVSEAQTSASQRAAEMAVVANELSRKQLLASGQPLLVLRINPALRNSSTSKRSFYLLENQGVGQAQHIAWWYGRVDQNLDLTSQSAAP